MPKIRQPKHYHQMFSSDLSGWSGVHSRLDRYSTQFGIDHLLITDGVEAIKPYLDSFPYLVAWMKEWKVPSFVYQRLRLIGVDAWLHRLTNYLETIDSPIDLVSLEKVSLFLEDMGFGNEDTIRFHQLCLQNANHNQKDDTSIIYTLRIGMVYLTNGHLIPDAFAKAEKIFLDCLASYDTIDSRADLMMVKLRNELAVLYARQGKLRDAYDLILEVSEDFCSLLGESSSEYFVAQTSIAWLEEQFGEREKAKNRLEETVIQMNNCLGSDSQYTLGAERQYLQFLQTEGSLTEDQAIVFKRKIEYLFGKLHNLYTHSNNILGLIYLDSEQYDKSEQVYREMIALSSENIDPMIVFKLALSLQYQGLNTEAAQCYEDSLQGALDLYGEHYMVAQISYDFANFLSAYQNPPNYKRAQTLLLSAKKIYTNTYGIEHAWVLTVVIELSDVYDNMGDTENAISCLKMYLDEAEALLSGWAIARLQYGLGRHYIQHNDVENAKRYLLQVLSYRREHQSHKPHLISNTLWYLYKCAYQQSDISQLFLYLEEAVQVRITEPPSFSKVNMFKISTTLCERYLEFGRREAFQQLLVSITADVSLSDAQREVLNQLEVQAR